jgi:hypothetical protein
MIDASTIQGSTNEDTTSCKGKLEGTEHDSLLCRKQPEITVKAGEDRLRTEQNKELTLKRALIDLTPPSKSHKLAINLQSPITANSPPNQPFHL